MCSKLTYNELMVNEIETFLSVRLSPTLREKLKRLAKKNRRSMNAQVVWVLEQYVAQEERQEGGEKPKE